MPTYVNDTNSVIAEKGIRFNPGQIHKTEYFLSDPRLTKLSDAPFYNPTLATHNIASTGPDDDQTVVLDSDTEEILIWKVVGATVSVYLNDEAAGLTIALPEASEVTLSELRGRVSQIVLKFSHSGICELLEVVG